MQKAQCSDWIHVALSLFCASKPPHLCLLIANMHYYYHLSRPFLSYAPISTMCYLLLEDINAPFISQIGHLAATRQAVSTVELLEAILLHLRCRDIILSQRVSKTWRTTIQRSLQVQRKIFFAVTYRDCWSEATRDQEMAAFIDESLLRRNRPRHVRYRALRDADYLTV